MALTISTPAFDLFYSGYATSPKVNGRLVLGSTVLGNSGGNTDGICKVWRTFIDPRASDSWHDKASAGFYVGAPAMAKVPGEPAELYNSVYSGFVRSVRKEANAALAVDLAEMRDSTQLILRTAQRLARAAGQIRKLKFRKAAATLGLRRPPNGVRRSKPFSENWLAYHFGWSPLLGSIVDTASAFSDPIRSKPWVRCTRTGMLPDWIANNSRYNTVKFTGIKRRITIGAQVQVTNPALARMEQFGVANPLAIAWALVPFSFVVDWFANVGSWLGSFTDFLGLTLINGCTTRTTYGLGSATGNRYLGEVIKRGLFYNKRRTLGKPSTPNLTIGTGRFGLWNMITTGTLMSTILR